MKKQILLLGQIGAGKTCFINHLLGGDYIPYTITSHGYFAFVSYGEKIKYKLIDKDNEKTGSLPLVVIEELIRNDCNKAEKEYISVEISGPFYICKNNIVLVDTPSFFEERTIASKMFYEMLNLSDIICYCINPNHGIMVSDIDFLQTICHFNSETFIITNNISVSSPRNLKLAEEFSKAVKYIRESINAKENINVKDFFNIWYFDRDEDKLGLVDSQFHMMRNILLLSLNQSRPEIM